MARRGGPTLRPLGAFELPHIPRRVVLDLFERDAYASNETCAMCCCLSKGLLRFVLRNLMDVRSGAKEVSRFSYAQTELFGMVAARKLKSNRRHGVGCGVVPRKHRTGSKQSIDPAIGNAASRFGCRAGASGVRRAIFEANNDQIHGSVAVKLWWDSRRSRCTRRGDPGRAGVVCQRCRRARLHS